MNLKLFKGKILRAWKDIEGYEGLYQVSTDGKVRSCDRWVKCRGGKFRFLKGKEKSLCDSGKGYLKVYFGRNDKKSYFIHRLVAQAFIPNPYNRPEVDHIDCDKSNNIVTNLRWVTREENMNNPISKNNSSMSKKGKYVGGNNPNSKQVYCVELNKIWSCAKECADELRLSRASISNCCRGKQRVYNGLHFVYMDIYEEYRAKNNIKLLSAYDIINNGRYKPIYCIELDKVYITQKECCEELQIDNSCLIGHLKGKYKQCHNLHFRYATKEEIIKHFISYE